MSLLLKTACRWLHARDCADDALVDKWACRTAITVDQVYCLEGERFYFTGDDKARCPGTIVDIGSATEIEDCEAECAGGEFLCDYRWNAVVVYCDCGEPEETSEITGGVLLVDRDFTSSGSGPAFGSNGYDAWFTGETTDLGGGCFEVQFYYDTTYESDEECVPPADPSFTPPPCPL